MHDFRLVSTLNHWEQTQMSNECIEELAWVVEHISRRSNYRYVILVHVVQINLYLKYNQNLSYIKVDDNEPCTYGGSHRNKVHHIEEDNPTSYLGTLFFPCIVQTLPFYTLPCWMCDGALNPSLYVSLYHVLLPFYIPISTIHLLLPNYLCLCWTKLHSRKHCVFLLVHGSHLDVRELLKWHCLEYDERCHFSPLHLYGQPLSPQGVRREPQNFSFLRRSRERKRKR